MDKNIMPRVTAEQISNAYFRAVDAVKRLYQELEYEERAAQAVLGQYVRLAPSSVLFRERETIEALRKTSWRHILELVGLQSRVSQKRWTEIERYVGESSLPEPTVEEIFALLAKFLEDCAELAQELFKEAYDFLRPEGYSGEHFKSNQQEGIGRRIVWAYYGVHWRYGRPSIDYGSHSRYMVVDRAMHLLDGKKFDENSYTCPLIDAIQTSHGEGETEYWKFRVFRNGHVHLFPKRKDLVDQLNAIGSNGILLKSGRQ